MKPAYSLIDLATGCVHNGEPKPLLVVPTNISGSINYVRFAER